MNDLETSILSRIGKKNPFKTPDGYFESLPHRVQSYCHEHNLNHSSIRPQSILKPQLAIVTGFCLFILIGILGYFSLKTESFSSIKNVDYYKIVKESNTDFDEIQLYEAFSSEQKKDSIKNSLNEELLEYIMYENTSNGKHYYHPKDIKP